MTNALGGVVATPSARTYAKWFKQGLPAAGVVAALLIWRGVRDAQTDGGLVFYLILIGAVLLLCVGGMVSYLKGARVTVTATEIDAVGFLWRHRHIPLSDVGVVVEVAGFEQASTLRPATPLLVVLGRDGTRLLRLNGSVWDTDDLHRIALATGAPIEGVGTVTPKELAARHPQSVTVFERHPWAMGTLLAVVIVIVIVAAVLLYAASSGSL